jgi:adenosine kinase
MSALVCGSLAFDTITTFPGHFAQQILPEQLHILNVSFLVPTLRREFGGCAGNIAYNLKLLGEDPLVMGTVGDDSLLYFERLERLGIRLDCVRQIPQTLTAQAFITTDLDDNQITAFHPGAMSRSHENTITRDLGAGLAIVSPDGKEGMIQHARELADLGVPFMFDPGQGLPMFSGEELLAFVEQATYVAVNDYEARMLEDRTGRKVEDLATSLEALILTRGAEGSMIFAAGERIDIPCAKATAVVDPTGCGDAYRAGLLHGIASGLGWAKTGRLASLMGAIKVASRGGQNHRLSRDEIRSLFRQNFGSDL